MAMSLRKLPKIEGLAAPKNFQWDPPAEVLAKWAERPLAVDASDDVTITMFDVIGEDMFSGTGVTAKRISGALRSIGPRDVTVKINSPGGDMFEGIAIYNLLRDHPAKVHVQVLGLAASAASIIAMAGDEVTMGLGSFLMVHRSWGVVIGNRNDMLQAADTFESFDGALVDIYEARTGLKRTDIVKMMDAETFMAPSEAVDMGFADEIDDGLQAQPAAQNAIHSKRRMDALLAKQGVPRSERRRLLRDALGGTHDAAPSATHDAGLDVAAIERLIETLRS
jgi:ATP-dependent protease ClpP protease subunit